MKRKNGKNIITSDDVTVLGKNSGKTLGEVLESLQNDSDSLKSNVKWLYKYGGVGGNGGGGGSTVTDKWTVVCNLGNIQIPETTEGITETKSILFSSAGTYNLYIHINNPGGDTYSVEYSYNGGKSTGKSTLNYENRWTCNIGLNLIENNTIHVSIMNGNMLEKTFDATHIINAYSIWSYLADNTGSQYETFIESGVEKYNLFIDDIKQRGLKFVTKYNSSVNVPVTYYYTKFKSSEEVRETGQFREGQHEETLLEVDAIDNLESMTEDDAAPYKFLMKLNIDNGEISRNISADFLPNDLYLKIIPAEADLILYTNTSDSEHQTVITGNKTFTITPYNGKLGGSGKVNITYFINDVQVVDSSTSLAAQDSITPGKAFQKTFVFSQEGWNKIVFRAGYGDRYKEFTYYIFTEKPSNIVDWFDSTKHPFSSAFYRYGDSTQNQVKLTKNGVAINPNTYISKNANDSEESETILSSESTLAQELMINIGIQYNYINDESKEIIEIPTTDTSDTNSLHIYQNKVLIGAAEPQGIFFLEEEEKYESDNKNNYHLITIARKYIRTSGISTHQYELSFYIDGVLQANTVQHVLPSTYDRFILKNGNYSINLLDITYFNNNNISETSVVQYWYAYQTRLQQNFENISQKTNLLNIFSKFNLERIDDDPQKLLTGHVSIIESTLMDLVQNISIPILCIEYEPSANKDTLGNPMQFLTPPTENASDGWSDTLYDPDSHTSQKLTIGIRWSNGTGTANTTLQTIDTSSILTPDGQQRSAKFTLDIQGSTTRSYKGKNYTLGIEFTDSSDQSYIPIFTPWFDLNDRNSFLPENSFTLKADIVDSSHTNNTCMGKFINENTNQFDDAKQVLSRYSNHIKNCLEGFPCLMFVHSTGDLKYYYLGIYNFNLGRTSNFNLGYSDLRALPELTSSSNKNFHIYSVARTTTNESYGSDIKQGLITAEIDGNEAWYDFSQYDESILFQLPNRPNDEDYMFSEIVSGKDTSGNLSQYTKSAISNFVKKASRSGGYVFDRIEKGFHNNIEYNYTTLPGFVPNARTQYKRVKNDETQTFEVISEKSFQPGSAQDFNSEDLINFIYSHAENDQENVAPYSNYRSIVEYYTICMAFGLLDSVQKNLNIKSWNEGNTFYLAFYDMDTCLGINNDGKNVSYYAFSDYWQNTTGQIIDHDENQVPIVLAPPITIYRDHAPKIADVSLYDVPSSYLFAIAKYAKSVIEYYNLSSSESNISIETLATPQNLWAQWRSVQGSLRNSKYFINEYYNGYMNGVTELMFNYNFRSKYFTESSESTYDQESSRFRGRSIGYLKDWLNKRFHILDAYFNLAGNREIYISDGDNYNQTLNPSSGYQIVYEQYPAGLITYSDDVNINKSIFGENSSISGDIDIIVQAPDYTPIIATVGRSMYRYLLEESSNKYNIKIRNNGTNKVIFGGSSMWTFIESIDSLAEGNVFIESDKLQVLNGQNGTVNAWDLKMPALQQIHLNSPNYAGNLVFDRDSNFYNLTTIDISNSKINLEIDNQVVREINLTNINSGKIDIQNCHFINNILFNNSQIEECYINEIEYLSQGSTLTLNGNSIRKLDIAAKTSLNLNLTINNDPSLTTLIVSGFKNVTVTNCPQLTNITSNGTNLTRLDVTNCLQMAKATLNVTGCSYIRITDGVLDDLKLKTSNNNFEALTTLLIPKSYINKIHYYRVQNGIETEINASADNVLDLTPLVNMDNLDLSYNKLIQYIYFPNNYSKPIPIRNTFRSCDNLTRIYGCIKIVNTNYTFSDLPLFSIHGTLSDNWKSYSKTKSKTINETQYNIVQTPMQLLSGEEDGDTHQQITTKYNTVTKQSLFQEGNNVTNIFFNSSISGTFYQFAYGTNLTQFDVYYLLNSFGLSGVSTNNVTLGYGAFYTTNSMFNYAEGNQFNRYTFYKCTKITNLSGGSVPIFNTGDTLWYSPKVNGSTITNNGLFSPLTGLKTLTRMTSGTPYMSRYVFRRSGNTNYPLTTIHWQNIGLIYDDIDNYEVLSEVPTFYGSGVVNTGEENKLGNLTDFFLQTPNIESITNTFNTPVINYDTLTFPTSIKTIYAAFNNSYGFGTFNWKHTFNSGSAYNSLTTITNAFTLSNYLNSPVEFQLSNDMFSNMPNLLYLGYSYDGSNNGGFTDNPADRLPSAYVFNYGFRGNGFNKTLENNTFPYNITNPIRSIINFCGIFAELYSKTSAPNITIEFPKNMFLNCYSLQNIAGLFENTHIPVTLTAEGFRNCHNLKNVSHLFYTSVSSTNDSSVPRIIQNESIPYRFFYLGETINEHNVYYGTDSAEVMNADIQYMQDNTTGTQFVRSNDTKRETTRKLPTKSIQYATECFHGQDKMTHYVWDKSNFNIQDYPNNNYIPFAYYKTDDNVWHTRPNDPKYTKQYDISSVYDGDPDKLEANAYCADSANVEGVQGTSKSSGTINYFCPPDLFNSFLNSDSTNINGMFKWCGEGDPTNYTPRNRSYISINSITNGRICPYLFNTISNIKYLTEFFYNCKGLNSYKVADKYYLIPPELFAEARKVQRLANTFHGMYFDTTPDYSFLSRLTSTLDVRGIFACCMYQSAYSIANVFQSNTLSSASGAFCVRPVTLNTSAQGATAATGPTQANEPNNCTLTNNLSSSRNANKNLTRLNTAFTYYRVAGTVTDSVISLDLDYNLRD